MLVTLPLDDAVQASYLLPTEEGSSCFNQYGHVYAGVEVCSLRVTSSTQIWIVLVASQAALSADWFKNTISTPNRFAFSLLACKRLGQNKSCNNCKNENHKESEERGLKCQPEWHSLIYIMFCILVIGDDESYETCKKARNTPKT